MNLLRSLLTGLRDERQSQPPDSRSAFQHDVRIFAVPISNLSGTGELHGEAYLQGPGQKHEASSFRVVIAGNDAFRVAKLVFDSFANATVQDGECEPITG